MSTIREHLLNPRIRGMRCLKCGGEFPLDDYFHGCPDCLEKGENAAMTFVYQGPVSVRQQERGFARYGDFLPYGDTVTLGEGNTPVVALPRLAEEMGVAAVYTKNEFQNPTGSHKDRMNPFITARAVSAGYEVVTCASSGNEAASLAAYAAAEGIACVDVSAKNITPAWKNACLASGAELVLTETSADRLAYQRQHMGGKWYCATNLEDIPTSSSPFGIQGYKTIAYELWEELGANQPDYILIPTCRGDLLYGIYEGYQDALEQGWLEKMPALVACEPIPRLERILAGEATHKDKFPGDSSRMSSIGGATATWQSCVALRGSGGFAISSGGDEIDAAVRAMGGYGLYLETSAAVVYHCLKKAVGAGRIGPSDTVLLVLTSSGYKNDITQLNFL